MKELRSQAMYRARKMTVQAAQRSSRLRGHALLGSLFCALLLSAGCEFITGPLDDVETDTQSPGSGGSGPFVMDDSGSGSGTATNLTSDSTGPGAGSTGTPLLSCCVANETGGCLEPGVESCVCNARPSCCTGVWDASCVADVDALGCGFCEDIRPPANADPCCDVAKEGHVGCAEPDVEACVCADDDYCCEEEWDEICADAVSLTGCGKCEAEFGPSCCFPQPGATCESDEVEACVCEFDKYCCEVQWDAVCADSVEKLGCGPCDGSGGTGSTGTEGSTGAGSTGAGPTTSTGTPTVGT